jgi:hypothetical protein
MKITKQTKYFLDIDGKTYEVPHDEFDTDSLMTKFDDAGNGYIAYLVRDEYAENPFDFNDGMGEILYSGGRNHQDDSSQIRAEMGIGDDWHDDHPEEANPYAFMLSRYEHGYERYEVQEDGARNYSGRSVGNWDTSHNAALWLPNSSLLEYINTFPEDQRKIKALDFCKSAIDEFNSWLEGDVWEIVLCEYKNGIIGDQEYSGNFIGGDHAMKELREAFAHAAFKKEAA